MLRFCSIASAVALATTLTSPLLAAPTQSRPALAQELIAQGQPDRACSVLGPVASTTNAEALMLLGLCNEQLGNLEDAISFYERTLRIVPNASLIRARLAALYIVQGRTQEAETQLGTAMTSAMVAAASDAATAVPANDPTVRLAVSRFFDSNINAGSSSENMTGIVFGVPLPMVIDSGSRAIEDSGTRLSVQGRHVAPIGPNFALMASAGLAATIHDTMSAYDRQSVALGAGLLYGDGTVNAMVQPSLQIAFEGGDIDTVRAGLVGLAERDLSEFASIFAMADIAYRHNPNETDRSAWDGRLSLGFRYTLTENLEVSVSYGGRSTHSDRPTESYFAQGPEIGLNVQLTDIASFGLSYGYEFAAYEETSSLFPDDRREDRHRFAAQLNVDLSEAAFDGLGLTARYEYSLTDATLPLYDSERHAAQVGLTYRF